MTGMVITEHRTVNAPLETVYALYADLKCWPEVIPSVVGVDVLYEDGFHQEFTMTVKRPGIQETVRGVRYCRAPYELELTHTSPPPGLSRMRGRYTFAKEADGRTRVTARRDFQLLDATEEDEKAFAGTLRVSLQALLDHFGIAAERAS